MKKISNITAAIFVIFLSGNFYLSASHDFLTKANQHYKNNQYSKALKYYKMALNNNENPTLSYYNMGNCFYQLNQHSKAAACYKNSLIETPYFYRSCFNLGILYYEAGDFGPCIAYLKRALKINKDKNNTIYLILANSYKQLNEFGLAAVYFEMAIDVDKTLKDAYIMLYEISYELGDLQEALKWLDKLNINCGKNIEIDLIRADLRIKLGNLDKALYLLKEITNTNPSKEEAWLKLIMLHHKMGNKYNAILDAELAISNTKSFKKVALIAANIAFETAYYSKAQILYGYAYKLGSAEAVIGLRNLQTIYAKNKDKKALSEINLLLLNN